jgi:hypothetical protein
VARLGQGKEGLGILGVAAPRLAIGPTELSLVVLDVGLADDGC